jgi:hypothetical protein
LIFGVVGMLAAHKLAIRRTILLGFCEISPLLEFVLLRWEAAWLRSSTIGYTSSEVTVPEVTDFVTVVTFRCRV